jgi:hypothetical protein
MIYVDRRANRSKLRRGQDYVALLEAYWIINAYFARSQPTLDYLTALIDDAILSGNHSRMTRAFREVQEAILSDGASVGDLVQERA